MQQIDIILSKNRSKEKHINNKIKKIFPCIKFDIKIEHDKYIINY